MLTLKYQSAFKANRLLICFSVGALLLALIWTFGRPVKPVRAFGLQQELTCDEVYTVQQGDWLSRIAEKYYGDPLAYDQLVAAANNASDDAYTDISDPNLIEPGWVLCVTLGDVVAQLADLAAQAPAGLAPQELANATYQSQYTISPTITLQNGRYSEPVAPGSATETVVRMTRHLAYGDMNGQPSAAVVLVTNPGGSGTFYDLHLMYAPQGVAVNPASAFLGDRVQINEVKIENSLIVVDMVQAGPDDPLCCPSQQVIKSFEWQQDQLVETSSQVVGTAEAGPPAGVGIAPDQISLNTQGLPYTWQAVVIPETPYDASQPPGPMGLPEHIEILFGVTSPADRQPTDPIMYLIPVNAYRRMWDQAGNPAVSKMIGQIEQYSFILPNPAPTTGLPALPYEAVGAGYNDLVVQMASPLTAGQLNETSASQTGYRFVGRWAQDANPVTNQGLRYVYQGFTNDGQYLVSFWYPVSTSALPNDISAVPADQMAAFNANPSAYITAMADTLNQLSADQWQPSLATLDALVASLQIQEMPVAGLQGKTWLWTEGPVQPGSPDMVVIPNPQLYQVTYGTDGVINFVADCNRGSMPYELRYGGMAGGMLAMAGPMTLAECGPDSLYNSFANSLSAAQNYRVRAGGNPLELILPAAGGTLTLTSQATPSP